jgi:hypothetical protein
MMSLCPKCGDFYADQSLAFCLADGTPLVPVEANSERWAEGSQVLAKKEKALTKRKQIRTLRRISLVTMVLLTMLVYGLSAKRYVYFVPVATPTPTPTPSPTPTPTPSCSPLPSCSPTPTRILPCSPLPSCSPTPTPTPTPDCSGAADAGEKTAILKSLGTEWQNDVKTECAKLNVDTPIGLKQFEPIFVPVEVRFENCRALVKAWYSCQASINGRKEPPGPRKLKTFRCDQRKGHWRCQRS